MTTDQLSSDLASLRIHRDRAQAPPGRAWGRWVTAAVVAVLAGALGWSALSARVFKTDVEMTEIRRVSPAQASIRLTSSGFVVAGVRSKVGAKLLGRVTEVLVRQGDKVELGQVLVRLDDAEARMAITAARARAAAAHSRLQSANATLSEARRQYERERDLAEKGASLRSTVEDLENRVQALDQAANAARSDAAAARAEIAELELGLEYLTVTAPIAGVVTTRPVDVGELVGPTGVPVLELADFSTLAVETDVPETRLGLVSPGSPAEIVLDAYPAARHRGRVESISPQVDRAKATVAVRVAFVDPVEGVLPAMAARVSVLEAALDPDAVREPAKLFVPGSAVVERGGERVVFRVDDGRARRERVTLGPPMPGGFELLQGPPDGTRVVVSPSAAIDEGYPVREMDR
ncbi:MAG: efflux RND transporter periplasmic adaptor subunit [Myxococcota bacterium]